MDTRNDARPVVSFSKLQSIMPMPNLLDVQVESFNKLVKSEKEPGQRWDFGFDRIFGEVFPINDASGKLTLQYISAALGAPKYSVEECVERDMTYASPLKAKLRLVVWEDEVESGTEKQVRDIIEKEVYLGDLPILTDLGTFVINGAERVVVSQLHRSPGVVFEESVHPNGTKLYSSRIIPFRGSWVEFKIDINDICYVHIDKKKKFPATALLRAFGLEKEVNLKESVGFDLAEEIVDKNTGEVVVELDRSKRKEIDEKLAGQIKNAGYTKVKVFSLGEDADIYELFFKKRSIDPRSLDNRGINKAIGSVLAEEIVDRKTGEVLIEASTEIDEEIADLIVRSGLKKIQIYSSEKSDGRVDSAVVKNTLKKDPTNFEGEALEAIYSLLRPGDSPNVETARLALESVFFDPRRYDLGRVGRYKINKRLGVDAPAHQTVLDKEDFVEILRCLIELSQGRGVTDDIDHLGNRRVRTVGELIANQFSVGLARMARLVRERMAINTDTEKIKIDDLVNARTVSAVIQAFFGSSQLSQFMDQTNPLAEMTHKRRLSALGPGGLTRERAGFEVRDVHYSHYGRMCPIETPEGPNIGLISSLTTYGRVNDLGFIETPYRKVVKGKVTDKIEWLSANEEEEVRIAQASAALDDKGNFVDGFVLCREKGDFPLLAPLNIQYMDVAPDQLVSVAAALIPFLEHDDANRALMGSNMQRQAVPLLYPDAPLVGTGLEFKIAKDSGAVITANRGGKVVDVTADEIVIDTGAVNSKDGEQPLAKLTQYDHYRLKKFARTNQDTAINQRPLVKDGQRISGGQIIADGPSTDNGELALGRNVMVAFMPWYGYNYEDAIVISEKLVKDDVFTSIHIQELELHVRDTKRGMEEITREIPNVSEENLVDLDERGIVRVGARLSSGDILVGKITPKGETELSPEEKLLTAIFGEMAKDVKDSSLRVPPGISGTVIDVKIFSRRIDDPLLEREHGLRIGDLRGSEREEIRRVSAARDEELKEILQMQTVTLALKRNTVEPMIEEGTKLTKSALADLDFSKMDLGTLKVVNKDKNLRIRNLVEGASNRIETVREKTEELIDRVFQPDELPPGVVQLVKVYVAEKRKIAVGDKMAGRHGNKGIIARIAPEEDMPFLPDGTPVDIVLNPLGVPSRMNVGQVLETHLGLVGKIMGFEAKTPVFHGASESEVGLLLKFAALRWAHEGLDIKSQIPAIDSARTIGLMELSKEIERDVAVVAEDSGVADSAKRGIGGTIDSYLGQKMSKDQVAFFDSLRSYLVEAGEELAGRKDKQLSEAFPAVKLLASSKKLVSGFDAAAFEIMDEANILPNGKVMLRDGRTGREFDFPVTVGIIYMLKLSHLVDDKIHARSIGPYSLVTQQPLAGKAQFGGQRFGEMEVWALEAYGAAHTLQEILTVKSDDVTGRSKVYEAIVKGDNLPQPGIPESFNVLVKELQALGLDVTLGREE